MELLEDLNHRAGSSQIKNQDLQRATRTVEQVNLQWLLRWTRPSSFQQLASGHRNTWLLGCCSLNAKICVREVSEASRVRSIRAGINQYELASSKHRRHQVQRSGRSPHPCGMVVPVVKKLDRNQQQPAFRRQSFTAGFKSGFAPHLF